METDLRLDKRALFEDLRYEPHPGQLLVHESKSKRRVLACGARWGKSTCAAMEAVAAALSPAESSLGWVVGPSYDLARRIFDKVVLTFREHLDHRIIEIAPRDHRLVVPNLAGGVSDVRAKSADNAVSLLGEALDWMILDEAARLRPEIWESYLSQRLIDRDGWSLVISTPRGKGWFYEAFKQGQGGDPDCESWNSPSWENPLLKPEVIEAERKRLPDLVFREQLGGEFLSPDVEVCGTCNDPEGPGVVILGMGEDLALCPDCGKPVSKEGAALRAHEAGRGPFLRVIRIGEEKAPLRESKGNGCMEGDESLRSPHSLPRPA